MKTKQFSKKYPRVESAAFLLELPCKGAKSLPTIALHLEHFKHAFDFFFSRFCPALENIQQFGYKVYRYKIQYIDLSNLTQHNHKHHWPKVSLKYEKTLQ